MNPLTRDESRGCRDSGTPGNDLRPDQNVPSYRKLNELVKLSRYDLAGVFHAP